MRVCHVYDTRLTINQDLRMQANEIDIAKEILGETGKALRSGDFARFRVHFCLPFAVWTRIGARQLATPDELEQSFERVRWHYRSLKVSDLVRRCEFAIKMQPTEILSVHSVELYRDGVMVAPPHRVLSKLSLQGKRWQIDSADYCVSKSLSHCRALVGDLCEPNSLEVSAQNDAVKVAHL